jgi:hypothetical protein
MPATPLTATAANSAAPTPTPTHETLTKWNSLRAYFPSEIICATYAPYHRVDISCHTRLKFDVEQIKNHIAADHGGGLMIKLRPSEKPVGYWNKFSEADIESLDFRCEICNKQVPFQVNHIELHMRPHAGKSRRLREGGFFNLTLRIGSPVPSEAESFEQFG